MRRGTLEYLVHWKGFPREEDTWEPVENLGNAPEKITEFHRLHPSAPRPIQTRLRYSALENFTEIPKNNKLFDWNNGKLPGKLSRIPANASYPFRNSLTAPYRNNATIEKHFDEQWANWLRRRNPTEGVMS